MSSVKSDDREDIPRFTLIAYLGDHVPMLLMLLFCLLGIVCILPVLGVGVYGTVFVSLFVAICAVVALSMDYLRKRSYYRELENMLCSIDQTAAFASLFDEPGFLEGRINYATAFALSRSSAASLADMRTDEEEYRRYIELWIHEIKTPIAAVKLMLSDSADSRSAKISREIERVESQVDQALYYARSTSVAKDYAIKEIVLVDAIREACKRNARFLIEHETTPVFDIDPELSVLTDEAWIIFMLGQVIVNASKYGASTITFSAESLDEDTASGRTVLKIEDDGCGIPASDVPRVFDRGFTGSVGRRHGASTGMGLYLIAKLCASLGLHVGLSSEEGSGTVVIFTFPHDRARKQAYL